MPPDPGAALAQERVLVVPPTRRDGEVTAELLGKAGLTALVVPGLRGLGAEIDAGVGVVVLTESALADPGIAGVLRALARQPAWSDVPTLVLTRDRETSPAAVRALGLLTNVTLLDRPV